MARIAIMIGSLLILLGVAVYGLVSATQDEPASITSLIPAFFGLPIVLAGIVALNAAFRKHAMHAVAVFALLGLVAPLLRLVMQLARGASVAPLPLISMLLMALLCGVLLALCIKSFVDVRRARSDQAP